MILVLSRMRVRSCFRSFSARRPVSVICVPARSSCGRLLVAAQGLEPFIVERGIAQAEPPIDLHVLEAGAGDLGAIEIDNVEIGNLGQDLDPFIGDGHPQEKPVARALDVFEAAQREQVGVGDFQLVEVNADEIGAVELRRAFNLAAELDDPGKGRLALIILHKTVGSAMLVTRRQVEKRRIMTDPPGIND